MGAESSKLNESPAIDNDELKNNNNENDNAIIRENVHRIDPNIHRRITKGVSYNLKIIIRGKRGTGKTQLFRRLQGHNFHTQYNASAEIQSATINWSHSTKDPNQSVKVEVWDIVDNGTISNSPHSMKDFIEEQIRKGSSKNGNYKLNVLDSTMIDVYKDSHSVVFMVNPSDEESFEYVKKFSKEVPLALPIVILLNFRDLTSVNNDVDDNIVHPTLVTIQDIERLVADLRAYRKEQKNLKLSKLSEIDWLSEELLEKEVRYVYTRSSNVTEDVHYFETSMLNCFGLKELYQYLAIPFMKLKISVAEEQIRHIRSNYLLIESSFINSHVNNNLKSYEIYAKNFESKRKDQINSESPSNQDKLVKEEITNKSTVSDTSKTESKAAVSKDSNDFFEEDKDVLMVELNQKKNKLNDKKNVVINDDNDEEEVHVDKPKALRTRRKANPVVSSATATKAPSVNKINSDNDNKSSLKIIDDSDVKLKNKSIDNDDTNENENQIEIKKIDEKVKSIDKNKIDNEDVEEIELKDKPKGLKSLRKVNTAKATSSTVSSTTSQSINKIDSEDNNQSDIKTAAAKKDETIIYNDRSVDIKDKEVNSKDVAEHHDNIEIKDNIVKSVGDVVDVVNHDDSKFIPKKIEIRNTIGTKEFDLEVKDVDEVVNSKQLVKISQEVSPISSRNTNDNAHEDSDDESIDKSRDIPSIKENGDINNYSNEIIIEDKIDDSFFDQDDVTIENNNTNDISNAIESNEFSQNIQSKPLIKKSRQKSSSININQDSDEESIENPSNVAENNNTISKEINSEDKLDDSFFDQDDEIIDNNKSIKKKNINNTKDSINHSNNIKSKPIMKKTRQISTRAIGFENDSDDSEEEMIEKPIVIVKNDNLSNQINLEDKLDDSFFDQDDDIIDIKKLNHSNQSNNDSIVNIKSNIINNKKDYDIEDDDDSPIASSLISRPIVKPITKVDLPSSNSNTLSESAKLAVLQAMKGWENDDKIDNDNDDDDNKVKKSNKKNKKNKKKKKVKQTSDSEQDIDYNYNYESN